MSVRTNSEEWIVNVICYIREMNEASTVHQKDVRNVRRKTIDKKEYKKLEK